jgi:RNA polymerase sigma-70 factor, ECF subfamily
MHPFRVNSRNLQADMVTAAPFATRTDAPAGLRPVPVPSPQCAAVTETGQDDVLTRAKAGDQAAFATLIRRHQNMVFSIALHMLRSRAAAEDLAQEVFLELYRSLARLESDAHVVSWLRRVAGHRSIDEIRRRNHRPEFPTDTLPETGHAPETREVFVAERLQALVAELPERARMVVVLRYQEEMEPTEIAQALSMPVNTVKSHLRRSVAALRERLTGGGRR